MRVARLQPGRNDALRAERAARSCGCRVSLSVHAQRPIEGGAADHVGRAIQPIVGGIASGADQDSVVALARFENGVRVGLCTATLVAANLALTARHCVSATDATRGVRLRRGAGGRRDAPRRSPAATLAVYATDERRRARHDDRDARERARQVARRRRRDDDLQSRPRVRRPRHVARLARSRRFVSRRRGEPTSSRRSASASPRSALFRRSACSGAASRSSAPDRWRTPTTRATASATPSSSSVSPRARATAAVRCSPCARDRTRLPRRGRRRRVASGQRSAARSRPTPRARASARRRMPSTRSSARTRRSCCARSRRPARRRGSRVSPIRAR